jgi:hypothetical protein
MNEDNRTEQADYVNEANQEDNTAAKPVRRITQPKKKDITRLNPLWFKKVCGLALKYGTTLQFADDGTVFGYSSRGSSTAVFYDTTEEGAKEWITEILKLSPKGAVFPCEDIFVNKDTQNILKSYANAPTEKTDGEGELCAYAWFDSVTKTLHMKADGVTIKTGTLVETAPLIPQHVPDGDIPDMVLRDLIPKNILSLLTNCLSKDETRKPLKRIYADTYKDTNAVIGTDGRKLCLFVNAGLPDDISIDPTITPPLEIDGYKSLRIENYSKEKGKENTKVYSRTIRFFKMTDGVVLSETFVDSAPEGAWRIVSGAENEEYGGSVQSQSLANVLSSIARLGLLDSDGKNMLMLSNGKITVQSKGADLAVFDADVSLPEDIQVHYAYEVLQKVSEMGVVIHQPTKRFEGVIRSPLFAKTDDCYFVAMPIRLT